MARVKKHTLTPKQIGIGLILGLIVGSLIPDRYNVVTLVKGFFNKKAKK